MGVLNYFKNRCIELSFKKNKLNIRRKAPLASYGQIQALLSSLAPKKTNLPLIRIGSHGDGGYLIPDDLLGIVACFSPGVSKTSDFELDLAKKGIPCYLADYSVSKPGIDNPLFHFKKKFLGAFNDLIYMTLDKWVLESKVPAGDLLLQMDIEGFEFDVLHQISPELLRRFRIIVIEFHNLDDMVFRGGYHLMLLTIQKLLTDFEVVHIHPNNSEPAFKYGPFEIPPLQEMTFLRKDRASSSSLQNTFPHPLDVACDDSMPDYPLPKCWFSPEMISSSVSISKT
jgi:hypothetical protein